MNAQDEKLIAEGDKWLIFAPELEDPDTINLVRALLDRVKASAEQEPVAWRCNELPPVWSSMDHPFLEIAKERGVKIEYAYAAPVPAQTIPGLREAAQACLDKMVDAEATGEESDKAYNLACQHCADTIRKLAAPSHEDNA